MKCPECGCEDIAITVQYRKSTLCRVIRFFILIALFYTIIFNMAEIITLNEIDNSATVYNVSSIIQTTVTEDNIPGAIAQPITPAIAIIVSLSIALIFCEIMLQWIESKKRVYYVCKQCNKIWFTQDTIE